MHVTRLAPSPTGALHLGNARTFLINWLMARQAGWKIILRIEDIDSPRIKNGADQQAIEDLRWLGIDWDEGPIYQSQRSHLYQAALRRLQAEGYAYYCTCSRKDIELAASAPHAADGAAVYPGTCRSRYGAIEPPRAAIRFALPDESVALVDHFAEDRTFDVARELGDFVIRKCDGTPAYHLAVVVDDLEMGVTQVVRGDDLLDSAPRQMLLYRALGYGDAIPMYWHLPLVIGPDGRRLAKRHGDTRLATYREQGVPIERILGLLARWCGIDITGPVRSAANLLERFDIRKLPKKPIIFTAADDPMAHNRSTGADPTVGPFS